MIDGQRILAIIPARGKSKTLPRKNLKILQDKPLIAWTIEAAMNSQYIDRLILSSEDEEIMATAVKWGCEVPFTRPQELALDETSGISPVIHAIQTLKETYDYVVLLQPTSPLRTTEDIDNCIFFCIQEKAASCVSVSPAPKSPYWMYTLNEKNILVPLLQKKHLYLQRQDLPPVYVLNGAIYMSYIPYLLKTNEFLNEQTLAYLMPTERSLDIDNEIDFQYCSLLLS